LTIKFGEPPGNQAIPMGQAILEAPAIVLNCYDHGESDKIVTFFCQGIGLVTGIAKGANRSKKRFVNKLELFSLLHIYYQPAGANSLAFIQKAEHVNSYLNLRKDIHLYSSADVIREFVLLTSREMGGDEGLFDLIAWSLQALDETKKNCWPILTVFLIRLLDLLGYRPSLSSCVHCHQARSTRSTYLFHCYSGTLFCKDCRDQLQNLQPVSHGTLKFLESARDLPLERLNRLKPSKQNIRESVTILHRYYRHLFQKDIHSWNVLLEIDLKPSDT